MLLLHIREYLRLRGDLKISRETLQLNLVIGLQLKLPVNGGGENGFVFVNEFKSIYTEYTSVIIVPEGYLTRFVTRLSERKFFNSSISIFQLISPKTI